MMASQNSLSRLLKKRMVICAEGFLFELERRGYLKAGPFVPEVVLDNPQAVAELHKEFLRAGSDVSLAFTYYADRNKLKSIGKEKVVEEMNTKALELAKKEAKPFGALVAGNICNTWVYDPKNKEKTSKQVYDMYDEQVKLAKKKGVDFVIAETLDYLGEGLIALEVISKYDLPAVINFAPHGMKTREGIPIEEACKTLEDKGALVTGINCSRGPKTMIPILKKIRRRCKGYIAALPVAYRTTQRYPTMQRLKIENRQMFPINLDPFTLTRQEVSEFTKEAKKIGVNFIGMCCGGAPHHIRAMSESLGRKTESSKYSADMSKHPLFGKTVKKHVNRDMTKDL